MAQYIESPYTQNDPNLSEHPSISRAGCLFRALVALAENFAGQTLSDLQILSLYETLVEAKHMRADCWVQAHGAVIDEALGMLGIDANATYLRRVTHDASVTSAWDSGLSLTPTHFIRHFRGRARDGNIFGHFVVADADGNTQWDTYFPWVEVVRDLSFRTYNIS